MFYYVWINHSIKWIVKNKYPYHTCVLGLSFVQRKDILHFFWYYYTSSKETLLMWCPPKMIRNLYFNFIVHLVWNLNICLGYLPWNIRWKALTLINITMSQINCVTFLYTEVQWMIFLLVNLALNHCLLILIHQAGFDISCIDMLKFQCLFDGV